MKRTLTLCLALVILFAMVFAIPAGPVFAADNWSEDWETFEPFADVQGIRGWKGWANSPAASALVYPLDSLTISIHDSTDLVHEFSGYTTGKWTFSVMQKTPAWTTGTSYFIMLNQYDDAQTNLNWSTQVQFDLSGSQVIPEMVGATTTALVKDAWVPIRVEIDLDADTQKFYYNDVLLYDGSWTGGLTGGGIANIGAVDLFANSSNVVYYDDFSLVQDISNLKPIVGDDEFSTVKNEILDEYVGGNDSDDGMLNPLTFFKYTDPTHGSLIFNADGTFRYTPVLNYVGDDQFSYFVYDGEFSTVGTVTIHVTDPRIVSKLVITGPSNIFVYKTHPQDYQYKVQVYDQYGQLMPDEKITNWSLSSSGNLGGVTISSFTDQSCIVTVNQNPNPSAGATFYIKASADNGKQATYKVKISKTIKK